MLEVQPEMLELQGPSRRAHLHVALHYWASAMSGAIGGAPPAAHVHAQCLAALYGPLPPAPGSTSGQGSSPTPGRPQPRSPQPCREGGLGAVGRDVVGMEGSAPQPFCPSPAKPLSGALRVWGFFFLQHSHEILLHGAA